MKRLLTIAAAAALLAGAAAVTQAQQAPADGRPRGGQMMGGQRMTEMLLRDVALSAEQQARLAEVNAKFEPQQTALREQMMAARQSGQPNPELMQAARELSVQYRSAIRALLTSEQQTVFDRNVEAMPQRGPGTRGARPPRA